MRILRHWCVFWVMKWGFCTCTAVCINGHCTIRFIKSGKFSACANRPDSKVQYLSHSVQFYRCHFTCTVRNLLCLLNKQNQDFCLLWYRGSRVWTVSVNMRVQLQLALMAEDNTNICGNELAARQKFQTCVHSRQTINWTLLLHLTLLWQHMCVIQHDYSHFCLMLAPLPWDSTSTDSSNGYVSYCHVMNSK